MKSMYSYQTSRLLKKFWMLFVIVIIFSASAKFTVYRSFDSSNNLTYMNKETAEIYNELIENSADKTLDQCDEYITDYELRSYAGGYNGNITAAVNKYKTELRSCFMVESIRSYARTGRGLTDANIPSDLVKNSRLYAAFPTPQVINDEPFLKFLELRAVDIMPIFVLLLVGVFVADSYEKRMDQQIRISKNSSAFFKSREIILSVAIFIMFTLSFFADLIISGTLHQSKYSTSSLQSVWQFDLASLMLTVRGTIIWLYVTRLMSLFITYGIFVLVANAKQVVPLFPTIMVRLSICFPFNVSDRSFENSFPSTVFKKTEYIYIAPDSKVVNFGVAAIYWLSSEYQNATGSRYPCAFVSSFSQRS